ncbi:MAG: T9SS type A sorting domain-containing protein [Bacteroidota bacterium]
MTSINDPASGVTGLTIGGASTLRWTITSGFGACAASNDDITINVDPTTTVSAAGPDQNLCNTTTAMLVANTPAGSETGTWSVIAGTALVTSVNDPLSGVTGLTIGGSSTLRWTITTANGGCAASTDDITINSDPTTTVSAAGPDQNKCNTTNATLAANAPAGSETGTWSVIVGTAIVTSVNDPASSVTGLTIGGTSTLRWTITSGFGACSASADDITINVDPTTTVSAAGPDQNLCNTTTATLAANAPAGSETGTWSVIAGTAVVTSVNDTASGVTGLTIGGSSTLRWKITSANGGCSSSADDIVITVNPNPTTTISPDPATVCAGVNMLLNGNPAGGSGTFTVHSWTGDTGPLSSTVVSNPTFNAGAGAYNLTYSVTDNNGCVGTDDITVTVNTNPVVDSIKNTDNSSCVAPNGTITIYASSGNAPYQYSIDGGTGFQGSNNFTGLSAGIYNIVVEDINSCLATGKDTIDNTVGPSVDSLSITNVACNGDSTGQIIIYATGATQYSIDSGLTFQGGSTFSNLGAGIYDIIVEDAGSCRAVSLETINEPPELTATISPDPSIVCAGIDLVLDGTPGGGTGTYSSHLWTGDTGPLGSTVIQNPTFNSGAAGTFDLFYTVTDDNGCDTTDSITVTVYSTPTASISPDPAIGCQGVDLALDGNPAGGSGTYTTHLWTDDTGPLSSTSISNPTFNSGPGSYNLTYTVTDDNGCNGNDVIVVVADTTTTTSVAGSDQNLCNTTTATLAANTPESSETGTWTVIAGTAVVTSINDPASGVTGLTIDGSSTLRWTITSSNGGCADSFDDITINSDPITTVSTAGPDQNLCSVTTAPLAANAPAAGETGTWTVIAGTAVVINVNNPTSGVTGLTIGGSSTLRWTITSGFEACASSTDDVTINVDPATTVSAAGPDQNLCNTTTATLAANVPAGSETGTWSVTVGTAIVPSINDPVSGVTGLTIGGYSTLRWTITTSNGGCTASFDDVMINSDPSTTVSAAGPDQNLCGTTTTILAGNTPAVGTGTWSVVSGTATITTPSSPTSGVTGLTIGGSSTLVWSISNGVCASSSDTITITVNITATANAGANDTICKGSDYTLSGTIGGSASTSTWTTSGTGSFDNASLLAATYTPSAVDIAAGTVTLTITTNDPAGPCTTASDAMILTIDQASTASAGTDAAICEGSNYTLSGTIGGSATSSTWTTSGTGTFDDDALPAATYNPSAADIASGTVTLTITTNDPAGPCAAASDVMVLTIYSSPITTTSGTSASCNGLCDGTATGTGGIVYLWDDPGSQTLATANGLCAGTYNVTVTDANGCTAVDSYTVIEPAALASSTSGADASCNGSCDGSAVVSPSGGTAPYTYLWDDPSSQTTASANGLCAGTYNVTVTDANGCTAMDSYTVIEPVALASSTSGTDASCNGTCDGVSSVSAFGGTGGYTYLWDDPGFQTTAAATGLCAGIYSVSVTDVNGCNTNDSVIINEPAAITISIASTDVSCNGGNDGTADLTVSGGTTPFNYLWSIGDTTEDILGVSSGAYIVTVTDANGCNVSDTVIINEPSLLLASTSGIDATCNGSCDGTASVTVSGGVSPYSFLWSSGGISSTETGLCIGTYTITVTDVNGCTDTAGYSVNEPPALVLTPSAVDANCGQSDGVVSVSVTGGTGAYTYLWNNPGVSTTGTVTGLPAATYTVTVTDVNNCSDSTTTTINDLGGGTASVTIDNNVPCNGDCDGQATASMTGGTAPFTYLWDDPFSQTNATATGLCAGIFTATITDAAGCTVAASDTVTEPFVLSASITASTDVSCYGGCDGATTVTASGGTVPYTYMWNDPGIQTTATATGLCPGIFNVAIYDANGCNANDSVIINEPTAITISITPTDASCYGGSDGSADLTVNGGTPPYTYQWDDPGSSITEDISGLSAGTYSVSITDANGCAVSDTIVIYEPAALTASTSGTDASCNGTCDGSALVTASGGASPYTYLWDDPSSQTTATAVGLCAGAYNVTITDANGCSATANYTVGEPPLLTVNLGNDTIVNGSIVLNAGSSFASYLWSTGSTTQTITVISTGTYFVTVTDSIGCLASDTIVVTISSSGPVAGVSGTDAGCNGACDGNALVTVAGGTTPYTYQWNDPALQTTATAINLCAGNYSVIVTDFAGLTDTAYIIVNEPVALTAVITGTNVSTCGAGDGSASITASGGTLPYSYYWSNGSTTQNISGLQGGTYPVAVTDANGCIKNGNVTILEPPAITTLISGTDVSTCGASDGAADLTIIGGIAPYTYIWSDGNTTEDLTGLAAGSYSVTIVDANGCITNNSTVISEPPTVSATITGTDVSCSGGNNASADLTVTGGTAPYTYFWSNGAVTEDVSGLAAGTYTVLVTDSNGCSSSGAVTITQLPAMGLSFTIQDVSACGSSDATATISVSGGTPPYKYLWSNGDTTASATALPSGIHYVTVTDANLCIAYGTVTVNESGGPSIIVNSTVNVACNAGTNGSVDISVNGGAPPYDYIWSNGNISQDLSNLGAGIYDVTVADQSGCIASASLTVTQPTLLSVSLTKTNASCNGSDGSASVSVSGGVAPYSYLWSTYGSGSSQSGLAAGVYSVTVIDANGCYKVTQVVINSLGGPTITVNSVVDVNCDYPDNGSVDISVTGGTLPYTFNWSNTDTTQDIYNLTEGTYNVTVTGANGCIAVESIDLLYMPPANVEICMITVDSTTGKNLIVWEKTPGLSIDSYHIYKEGTQAGAYFQIGAVPYDSLSVFVDLQANPLQRSWRYKLTAGDTCLSESESELSPMHKSIHLTVNLGINGEINLIWDHYEGFDFGTYYIYRGPSYSDMDSIDAVPSNLNSYTDLNPPSGQLYYQVAAIHPQGCTATLKAKNYNSSKSNTSSINSTGTLSVTATANDATQGICDGTATANISGGALPYTYKWDDPNSQTIHTATGLCGNTSYTVTVTDDNGDTASASVLVGETIGIDGLLVADFRLQVYPNPSRGVFTVEVDASASVSIKIFNILGQEVKEVAWNSGNRTEIDLSSYPTGIYNLQLITGKYVVNKKIIIE